MTGQQGHLFGQLDIFDGIAETEPATSPAAPATVLGSVCVMTSCLAHRRAGYWNIQDAAWVHADGWQCPALTRQPGPDW